MENLDTTTMTWAVHLARAHKKYAVKRTRHNDPEIPKIQHELFGDWSWNTSICAREPAGGIGPKDERVQEIALPPGGETWASIEEAKVWPVERYTHKLRPRERQTDLMIGWSLRLPDLEQWVAWSRAAPSDSATTSKELRQMSRMMLKMWWTKIALDQASKTIESALANATQSRRQKRRQSPKKQSLPPLFPKETLVPSEHDDEDNDGEPSAIMLRTGEFAVAKRVDSVLWSALEQYRVV